MEIINFILALIFSLPFFAIMFWWTDLGGKIAFNRGNSYWGGFWLAFLIGPLGMLVAVLIPKDHRELARQHRRMPFRRERRFI